MSEDPPLVYLDLALEGLEETLGVPAEQLVRADDRPGPARRARVKVLVAGGPTHLPVERVDCFPGLTTIVSIAAGHDLGIDLDHARSRGIAVASGWSSAPGRRRPRGRFVDSARSGINTGDRLVREGAWYPRRVVPTPSVGNLKVGVVGLGTIGVEFARRMMAFGCSIAWHGPREKDVAWPRVADLHELSVASDVLLVAAPLSDATRGMVDARVIDALGCAAIWSMSGEGHSSTRTP